MIIHRKRQLGGLRGPYFTAPSHMPVGDEKPRGRRPLRGLLVTF